MRVTPVPSRLRIGAARFLSGQRELLPPEFTNDRRPRFASNWRLIKNSPRKNTAVNERTRWLNRSCVRVGQKSLGADFDGWPEKALNSKISDLKLARFYAVASKFVIYGAEGNWWIGYSVQERQYRTLYWLERIRWYIKIWICHTFDCPTLNRSGEEGSCFYQ